jgi:hypothetical protein
MNAEYTLMLKMAAEAATERVITEVRHLLASLDDTERHLLDRHAVAAELLKQK